MTASSETRAPGLTRAELGRLYAEASPALYRFVLRQVGDRQLAADLTQEAFMRLLTTRPENRSLPEIKGYLYRAAASLAADYWRRRKRERLWELLPFTGRDRAPDEARDLNRVFVSLKPRERTLLWLAYVEEMTHAEIAQALEVKTESVKVLLLRARRRLAAKLEKHGLGLEAKR